MNTIGMPYGPDMILAKMKGQKTHTRRVIIPQPQGGPVRAVPWDATKKKWVWESNSGKSGIFMPSSFSSRRGGVGDIQYWQEAFDFGGVSPDGHISVRYKANSFYEDIYPSREDHAKAKDWKRAKGKPWRGMPAMFMLESMARGRDKIIDIRVERVQDITEEDSKSEGISTRYLQVVPKSNSVLHYVAFQERVGGFHSARAAYECLWEEINYERGYGWETNPWVMVYITERLK